MKFYLSVLIFCLSFSCVSCKKQLPTPQEKVPAPRILNLNFSNDIPTLDPRRCSDPISCTMLFMLFEGLTSHSPGSSTKLALAKHIEISKDLLTYTFTLKDAYWSNGQRIIAKDFERSWKDMLTPEFPAPNANLLYPILNAEQAKKGALPLDQVGIHCPNNHTLIVQLESPTPYFLELTSFCPLFPAYSPRAGDLPYHAEHISKELISSGPFRVSSCKIRDKLILKQNPYYYQPSEINIDQINISFVHEEMTALELFNQGSIDILGLFFSSIPHDALIHLKKTNQIQFKPIAATSFISFNLSSFPFNNSYIRKAVHHAINRDALIKNVTELDETVATSLIPPILLPKEEKYSEKDFHDEALAKEYFMKGLKQLKISAFDIPPITLTTVNSEPERQIAQAIQDQLVNCLGLQVKLEEVDFMLYLEKAYSRNYQLVLCKAIAQYNDQMDLLSRFAWKGNTKNYPGWENTKYSKVLEMAIKLPNINERYLLYKEATQIMNDDLPISPLYHFNMPYMVQPGIKGLHISPIGSVHINSITTGNEHE
ncbi:MAG: peptide ABC transporter substrate-binding protein [Rhabdochlamydiaceae bacterium]|nr:peptide ABC transporter substrate-binding protein [Candidatus Amphrikana amoebophyrae]